MNKSQLIKQMTEDANISHRQASLLFDVFVATITKQIYEGEIVQLIGFGTFSTKYRHERVGRNPKTGEELNIPACHIPVFKPSKSLIDHCNL